ncbi:Putative inorganic phosphate transporter [Fulvia fulva]|uniref:Inorganic phosphate transporter n=1 Tax=Passalora fulva TaxID=5499 RepID=A0A9Q8L799_PASFU|nr:Putative inorganic phosphate transporter [Fulvia fulva]KAK4636279.1 putative inorganic phosphate transporter [Fulvia fulva]KAK4636407.1 putative inorganic phosphate transporter [Fulvia fulva]UJO12124.1 Putative inorganic phosphate transporter [Fulvia fulva]WPV08882.1 Putative inorganic phosphate transporter [Fulvia fulva]WPV25289.1 Putative inorganic phosphate transporter [Fulvia fulva]
MGDSSMRDYGLAAPHGPNTTGHHVATADLGDMNNDEASVFRSLLLPDDSYDEDGTYWADMKLGKRINFIRKVDNEEAKKELKSIGRMIKADPLSPVSFYFRNMVIPGMGLLLEGYVLFSIGNVKPLFQSAFPDCWDNHTVCNKTWIQAVDYLEICGIIVGQILVGVIGDWLGRRWGLIQDAVIMFLGLVMLTASWGVTLNGWVICYVWSLFFYGVGVGGEYPMTATSGMENAVGSSKISTREDRLHRGRKVTSAFLMQGWGQWFNQVILILLLLIFHGGSSSAPYGKTLAQWTYRVSFAIPAVGTLWLVYYRTYKMRSASKQLQAAKKKSSVTGYDVKSLKMTFQFFGGRVLATAGAWYANDIFFYGNKLFQSEFISTISGDDASIMVNWLWNLLNIGVSLVGYYLASFLIDHKLYGRKWMQIVGFLGDFICFIIPAFNYSYYAEGAGVHKFMAMYFLSSFFNQFGPNSVTFLVAAEVFPTPVRASAHGFSAAWGKLGALTAAVLYNYIDIPMRFLVVPWFGLAGAILTWVFLPDTTGLDLKEQERRWAYIRAGRDEEYCGVAVHPQHLSLWERMWGLGKRYNAEKDYEQRVEEMRADWEAAMAARAEKEEAVADDDWSDEVSTFFERTRGKKGVSTFKPGDGDISGPSSGSIEEEKASEKINGQ